jgi:hypothetical protein
MASRMGGRWEKANRGGPKGGLGMGIGPGLGSEEDRVRGRSTEYRVRIIECRL